MTSVPEVFCRKHLRHARPYIVCAHVAYDGAAVDAHVKPEDDPDRCGQLLCIQKHWPPQPGDREPVVMCAACAQELAAGKPKLSPQDALREQLRRRLR